MPGTDRFIMGRQPIFDAHYGVHGYELLFRNGDPVRPDGDVMTADVLVHAGLDSGLRALVGTKPAFVNTTRSFLVGDNEMPLSPEEVVIEVLGEVQVDSEVLAGCRRLVRSGFTLALDGYASEADDALLDVVSIVKLDVLRLGQDQLDRAVQRCRNFPLKLVAKKVEARQQFNACLDLGFDLFQGYLLSRPEVVEGTILAPSKLTCLRVLDRLCDPQASFGEVEDIVRSDPGLSYRFLKAAGVGAHQGLFRRLDSVRDALVLLGERRLRAWVVLMLLAGAREGSDEQFTIAMTRARMAELMALSLSPRLTDAAFTAGLVSSFDLLLHAPLSTVLEELSLSAELQDALLHHSGVLGDLLDDVITWELGAGHLQLRSGVAPGEAEHCYLQALSWANEVCQVVSVVH